MRWYELFERVSFSLPEHQGSRRFFMTSAFQKDFAHYKKYAGANVPKLLNEFLRFKQENGMKPYGAKDAPMNHDISAWHYHVVHGKVIILYSLDDTHIELYRVLEHADYDSAKQCSAIGRYINNLRPSDFVEYILPSPTQTRDFDPQTFDEIEEFIYSLTQTDEDREVLKQFVQKGTGLFREVVLELIDAEDQDAVEQFCGVWLKRYNRSFTDTITKALSSTKIAA